MTLDAYLNKCQSCRGHPGFYVQRCIGSCWETNFQWIPFGRWRSTLPQREMVNSSDFPSLDQPDREAKSLCTPPNQPDIKGCW